MINETVSVLLRTFKRKNVVFTKYPKQYNSRPLIKNMKLQNYAIQHNLLFGPRQFHSGDLDQCVLHLRLFHLVGNWVQYDMREVIF